MKASDFDPEIGDLASALTKRLSTEGTTVAYAIYKSSTPLILWIGYLSASLKTGSCDSFLDGIKASIIEGVACGAAGLVRPSIFAMRAQIDILFAWLYFKDHPVEWTKVEDTGEGFLLKRDALIYLGSHIPSFDARYGALLKVKTRSQIDPYKLLSAHVHAQGISVLPNYEHLYGVVSATEKCMELASLQSEVTEYLSDILLASYGPKWASLPDDIVSSARRRLTAAATKTVFN